MPPSFITFNEVDGMKVHFRDLGNTPRLDLERELFHFLMRLTQEKELSLKPLFLFLNELDTR